MKVLYVEDNPANVALVKRVARMGSHEIINYIDGDQALAKFDEINPDLVLMDIQLAGQKTGLDVVKELRSRGITKTIIAVTAYAMVGDKERALAAGCDAYLPKPLPINQLIDIFKEHSERIAQAQQKTTATPQTKDTEKTTEPVTQAQTGTSDAPSETKTEVEVSSETTVTPDIQTDVIAEASDEQVDKTPTDIQSPVAEAQQELSAETPVAETSSEDEPKPEQVDKDETIPDTVTLSSDSTISLSDNTKADDTSPSTIISQPDASADHTSKDENAIVDEPAKN